jgi:hypothetical protein
MKRALRRLPLAKQRELDAAASDKRLEDLRAAVTAGD